jgi:hypothetical protein
VKHVNYAGRFAKEELMGSERCKRVRQRARAVHEWPLWQLPRWLVAYIMVTTAGYVLAIVLALTAQLGHQSLRNLWLCGLLLLCTALTVELTKRSGENAGLIKDVFAVWELPVAILLPPIYALLVPAFRLTLTQLRIRRVPLHRRVFTIAVIGLSYASASVVFHGITGQGFGEATHPWPGATLWVCALVAAAVTQWIVNTSLLFPAIKGADPTVSVRELYLARERVHNDVAELCVAVLVTPAGLSVRDAAPALFPPRPTRQRLPRRLQDRPAQRGHLGARGGDGGCARGSYSYLPSRCSH